MHIRLVLAGGLALIAIAVIVTLSRAPLSVAASNGVPRETAIAKTEVATGACQTGETLPAGTSAIRLGLAVTTGPRVAVAVHSGARVITSGARGTGWNGGAVTIPVTPLGRTSTAVAICFRLSRLTGAVQLIGAQTPPGVAATDGRYALPGRMSVEYLRPGGRSWWSLIPEVIRHLALGRAAAGTWVVIPIAALGIAVIACSSLVVLRELR